FLIPLAPPGDDVKPQDFVCFRFAGNQGLYIHPNVWHEGVFGASGTQRFFDKQGAVHARVSLDFAREFGCLLEAQIDSRLPYLSEAATGSMPAMSARPISLSVATTSWVFATPSGASAAGSTTTPSRSPST